jgi:hypothetical protein
MTLTQPNWLTQNSLEVTRWRQGILRDILKFRKFSYTTITYITIYLIKQNIYSGTKLKTLSVFNKIKVVSEWNARRPIISPKLVLE